MTYRYRVVSTVAQILALACAAEVPLGSESEQTADSALESPNWFFLSNGSVITGVVQTDSEVWIGTTGGLVKIDTLTGVKSFLTPGNSGLPDLQVNYLAVDGSGFLWTATPSGISRFDGASWESYRYDTIGLSSVVEMKSSGAEDLVVANTSGIVRYTRSNSTWRSVYTTNAGAIQGIAVENTGTVWFAEAAIRTSGPFDVPVVFEGGRLARIESGQVETAVSISCADVEVLPSGNILWMSGFPEQWAVSEYHPDGTVSLVVDGISSGWSSLYVDVEGKTWVLAHGMSALIEAGSLQPLHLDAEGETPLSLRHVSPDGSIWASAYNGSIRATTYDGLFRRDSYGWQPVSTGNSQLPTNHLNDLAVGKDGVIWIATSNAGLIRLGEQIQQFTTENSAIPYDVIGAVAVDPAGDVWLTTFNGYLARFDGVDFTTWVLEPGPPPLSHMTTTLDASCPGEIWIGSVNASDGGLYRFDGNQLTFYNHAQLPTNHSIVDVECGPDGTVWFGTMYGNVAWLNGQGFDNFNSESTGAPIDYIQDIQLDPVRGGIWVAHRSIYAGGLSYFDGAEWTATDLSAFEGDSYHGPHVLGLSPTGNPMFVMAGRLGRVLDSGVAQQVGDLDALWGFGPFETAPNGNIWFVTSHGIAIFNESGVRGLDEAISFQRGN